MYRLSVSLGFSLLTQLAALYVVNLPAAAQVVGIGNFGGTVAGKEVIEQDTSSVYKQTIKTLNCQVDMKFRADGTMAFRAGRYLNRFFLYSKYKSSGAEERYTDQVTSPGANGQRNSELLLWLSRTRRVLQAKWRPAEYPGVLEQTLERRNALTGWKWKVISFRRQDVLVYCEPYIYWRGVNGKGPGKPLQGSYQGQGRYVIRNPVTAPDPTTIRIDAYWKFRPL